MKIVKLYLIAALASFLSITVSSAAPVDFSFSFSNDFFDVSGVIYGLEDDTIDQAAQSVIVESNTRGFGLGDYVNDAAALVIDNRFSVSGGEIIFADFASALLPDSLLVFSTVDDTAFLMGLPGAVDGSPEFNKLPTPVPLPYSFPLLAAGMFGLACLKRRRSFK
ncbi:VPLPA-CTERM sorting domain-containing protein [Roseibium sp. HPY-6]|uniref:VPLPA-CTERM sorting domain-containing protein n=1 Tax=Roseibium sp. HPY-6 TaxID=3229852 RepID=UPI00338F3C39